MSKQIIRRLNEFAARLECYTSDLVRKQAKAQLQALADSEGYSYLHYLATGKWELYETVETVSVDKLETFRKNIETDTEPKRLETEKKPSIRKETVFYLETETEKVCDFCKKRFVSSRSVKRFCTDKCKRDYNNMKRYKQIS